MSTHLDINMFKIKNTNTLPYVFSIICGRVNQVIKQPMSCTNTLWISTQQNNVFGMLNNFSETAGLFAVDSTAVQNPNTRLIDTVDVFYSYKYDLYLILIQTSKSQRSLSSDFYNRIWLERETAEMFGITYNNLTDTRPLLLNYGDKLQALTKVTTTQPNYEYRTNWHSRVINKIRNQNVEL